MTPPDDLKFLEPWRKIEPSERAPNREQLFSAELKREVPAGHVLHGLKVRAVAFRIDRDDVLFELEGGNAPLAVVHMTWKVEVDPYWPATELFASWEDWARKSMTPAHKDYIFPEQLKDATG